MMGETILVSKFQVPAARPAFVSRPRLAERLSASLAHRLTLVSAPAGSGKTTLLAHWLHEQSQPAAWLSLDASDNDPHRFLTYLAAAMRDFEPAMEKSLLSHLRAGELEMRDTTAFVQSLMTRMVNELAQAPEPAVIVLDDYHYLEAPALHAGVSFLLDHAPSQVHLIISTRSDPPLPLSRLRAQGQLLEIRAADLRFTTEESGRLLNDVLNLRLSSEDVAALEERTQGWAAGLQLAAHSLQSTEDAGAFVRTFAGTNRFVLDYLVDEVLQAQTAERHSFLLVTSILDRLHAALCDHLTGRNNGQAMLESLAQDNLFITPLDEERQWYRYHPLFADLLQHRLAQDDPEKLSALHRKASLWHERRALREEAIRHALAAGDTAKAAELIEGAVMSLLQRGRQFTLERWIEALPEEVRNQRPQLCLLQAWVRLFTGKVELYERPLQRAEAIWEAQGRRDRLGQVLVFRANVARLQRNPREAITLAEQALAQLPQEEPLQRSIGKMVLGDAYVQVGEVARAEEVLDDIRTPERAAGNRLLVLIALNRLADAAVLQGQLHRAREIYEDVLQRCGEDPLWQRAEAHLGLGRLYRQWNQLPQAAQHLSQVLELGEQTNRDVYLAEAFVEWAWLLQSRGDHEKALAAMNKALRLARQFEHPNTARRIAAHQARLRLYGGDRLSAERWLEDADLPPAAIGDALREEEFLAAVRLRLAQGKPAAAAEMLAGLRPHVAESGRTGTLIEIMALQALAYQGLGREDEALDVLHAALQFAEPAAYVRLFTDEGAAMAHLLQRLAAQQTMSHYVSAILQEFGAEADTMTAPQAALVEPLTERELQVLSLMAQGATNREIAATLVIALTTTKKHVSNILGKLAVSNRTEAAARGRELNLI